MPATGVLAPDRILVAVRAMAPVAGSPPKSGDTMFATPCASSSTFELCRVPDMRSATIADISDGTSKTLLVVEGAGPVPWTKPEELPFDPDKPLPKMGGQFDDIFIGAMADGSVRIFPMTIPEKTLRALITRNGKEPIDN